VDSDLPLLSIAITVKMRTGKSFLLNLFLMYLEYIENKVIINFAQRYVVSGKLQPACLLFREYTQQTN